MSFRNKAPLTKRTKINSNEFGFILLEILISLIISSVMLVGIMDEMHMVWLKRQRINAEVNYLFLSRDVISLFDQKGWSGPGVWNGIDNNISWMLEAENIEYNDDKDSDPLTDKNNVDTVKMLSIHIYVIKDNYKKDILDAIRIYHENGK